MVGQVRERLPRVTLLVAGRHEEVSIEFTVDTAFEGELALPLRWIERLGLGTIDRRLVRFADGSLELAEAHEVLIEWEDESLQTSVLVLNGDPLLGVELLEGCFLQCEMTEGGAVEIGPL